MYTASYVSTLIDTQISLRASTPSELNNVFQLSVKGPVCQDR